MKKEDTILKIITQPGRENLKMRNLHKKPSIKDRILTE